MKGWMNIAVGLVLTAILVLGSLLIIDLNKDAREIELNGELAMRGQSVSTSEGCIACHTVDGSAGIGPTWLGMFGRTETLTDGSTVVVDEAYFRESIIEPNAKKVEGYPNVMLRYFLVEEDIQALLEFARQLGQPE